MVRDRKRETGIFMKPYMGHRLRDHDGDGSMDTVRIPLHKTKDILLC